MKFINGLFLAAFGASAVLQWNDPDPLAWMLLYGAAAGVCALWYRADLSLRLPSGLLIICLLWLATLLPQLFTIREWGAVFGSLQMQSESVEEVREAGGLLLIAAWMTVLMLSIRKRSGSV